MKINIGGNLRKLRHDKGITQEQLAEIFGVSAQAVSRWENDSAHPDIELLPGLAIFFNTTVDAIIGMEDIRKDETLCKIHTEINTLVTAGKIDEAVEYIRDSLRTYPSDSGLLMSLGETLAHKNDDPKAAEEAISIAERVLQNSDVSMNARSTTLANLLFLYIRTGKIDKAEALVRALPHIWESREVLLPELCDGDFYKDALKKSIMKVLVFFCGKIDNMSAREYGSTPSYIQLGVDFEAKKDTDEMLKELCAFLKS